MSNDRKFAEAGWKYLESGNIEDLNPTDPLRTAAILDATVKSVAAMVDMTEDGACALLIGNCIGRLMAKHGIEEGRKLFHQQVDLVADMMIKNVNPSN